MAYAPEEKALAIAILKRYGGMTMSALADIEAALGRRVSTSTLHGWLPKTETKVKREPKSKNVSKSKSETTKKTPGALVTPDVQAAAEVALDRLFEDVARAYLRRAADETAINATKGKDAVIAAATAVDKMRLLRGLPTEIVAILPDVIEALNAVGIDPVETFVRLIQKAHERAAISRSD